MQDGNTVNGRETAFLWFSGKGGTGKTTISAATALQLADRGRDVLLISTDPAHSLSDALDMDIDGETVVNEHLTALELDPEAEVDTYQAELQQAELDDALGLMAEVQEGMDIMKRGPGVAEMAAFNRFMEYMHGGAYDVIVFDTAPTGHTLNLLQLPEVMDSMVGKVLRMRMRFSAAVDTVKTLFGQQEAVDHGVAHLEEMQEKIGYAREVMTDPARTSFNFVMLPETMSLYETERAVAQVEQFNIPIGRLFVNQLLPENPDCAFCSSRRAMQQENLQRIHDAFGMDVVEIPLFDHEVQGMDDLHMLAGHMSWG